MAKSVRLLPLLLTVLLASLDAIPPAARAGSPELAFELSTRPGLLEADARQVIVTTIPLYNSFERLAQFKRDRGTTAVVIAVEQIDALYPDAVDLAEAIREFLSDAHQAWQTEYVLLGGDAELVPARTIPDPTTLGVFGGEIVTDLYYAALDGDWNADGDAIIGEIPDDNVDFEAELAIGRAPVVDASDADTFVDKTIIYTQTAGHAYRGRGLVLTAEHPEIGGVDNVLVRVAEGLLTEGLSAVTPVPYVERRYGEPDEFPDWEPMDHADAVNRLGSGDFGWVLTVLHGDSEQMYVALGQYLMPTDFENLQNGPSYFVSFNISCQAANFPADCLLEAMLRNPQGGCVAGVSQAGIGFVSVEAALGERVLAESLGAPGQTLGEAMKIARSQYATDPETSLARISTFSWTLLGDPQLLLRSEIAVASPSTRDGYVLEANRPNPFNPGTEIRYSIPRGNTVELSIFDARGRRVTTLVDRFVEAGRHVTRWDGRDAFGRPAASGVYFYRLTSGERQLTRKMVLAE